MLLAGDENGYSNDNSFEDAVHKNTGDEIAPLPALTWGYFFSSSPTPSSGRPSQNLRSME